MPRSLPQRVRVRHTSGAEKDVQRSNLPFLLATGQWERVSTSRKKRPPEEAVEPTTTEPAETPDTPKE